MGAYCVGSGTGVLRSCLDGRPCSSAFETETTMKKILMALYCLNPAGGVEQYVVSILPELRHQGIDVILCTELPIDKTNQYYQRLQSTGFKVHYPHIGPFALLGWSWVPDLILVALWPLTVSLLIADRILRKRSWKRSYTGMRGRLNNILASKLPKSLQALPFSTLLSWLWLRHQPDLLHVLRVDTVCALQWGLRAGVPLVYTEALEPGGDRFYPHLRPWYRELEKIVERIPVIITQSERVRKAIRATWSSSSQVAVIPWVVEVPPTQDNPIPHRNSVVFASAGRLSPEKDIGTFLEAAKLLVDKFGSDTVNFLVAGSGPEEANLKEMANGLGLGNQVRFSGHYSLDQLAEIYSGMDVFVISSLTEGAPLAVMEAMAYAKPVVATDVAGTGELVENQMTGFLVAPKDPHGLAAACERFVNDRSMIEKMGQAAGERYQRLYTPRAGTDALRSLYQQLLGN